MAIYHRQPPIHAHGPRSTVAEEPRLTFDYDPVSGRLLVRAQHGGFVIFHGVPIATYIGLRFSPMPGHYLRERLMSAFAFVCSSACWPPT